MKKKCPHGKRSSQCRECSGSSFCDHGRNKWTCRECGGASFCVHGRRKTRCKECGGSGFCRHGIRKEQCRDCLTTEQIVTGDKICHACCSTYLSPLRRRNGIALCAGCDSRAPLRIEKIVVPLLLSQIAHPASAQDNATYGGEGCDARLRRPDTLWLGLDRVVSLEVDEHSHRDRTTSCELAKMHDQFVAWQKLVGFVPVFYVRFNPNEYDGGCAPLDHRVAAVARRVNELLTMDVKERSSLVPHVEYHYYHSDGRHHIEGARAASDSFICSTSKNACQSR